MSLIQDVTFDSLDTVKQEIREWLGPENIDPAREGNINAARDALIAVLIHTLAEELGNARVRTEIQALLAPYTLHGQLRPSSSPFNG